MTKGNLCSDPLDITVDMKESMSAKGFGIWGKTHQDLGKVKQTTPEQGEQIIWNSRGNNKQRKRIPELENGFLKVYSYLFHEEPNLKDEISLREGGL